MAFVQPWLNGKVYYYLWQSMLASKTIQPRLNE